MNITRRLFDNPITFEDEYTGDEIELDNCPRCQIGWKDFYNTVCRECEAKKANFKLLEFQKRIRKISFKKSL